MKNNFLRVCILLILIFSILLFVYVGYSDFELLNIKGNTKGNFYIYLKIMIASFFAFLFLLIFRKKYNFVYFLNLFWIIPIFVLLINLTYGTYNIKKIDFLIGRKLKSFEVTEYVYKSEQIKRIVIGKDTLLYSPMPCCEDEGYLLEEIKNSDISKSWITGYYYISVPKRIHVKSNNVILP